MRNPKNTDTQFTRGNWTQALLKILTDGCSSAVTMAKFA